MNLFEQEAPNPKPGESNEMKRRYSASFLGKLLLTLFTSILFNSVNAQNPAEAIRLNQVGFYPQAPKLAVVINAEAGKFSIHAPGSKKVSFEGTLSESRRSPFSDKTTRIADFSALTQTGKYVLEVPGTGISYPFEIKSNVHEAASKAAIKGYYFQRLSMPLDKKYAGKWARPAGNPDTDVKIHPSAVGTGRPAGTSISSPGGWLDAGDYNKYIVNSGITMGTLLSAYEDFPEYYYKLTLNIPESNNQVPDLLDEVLWNLRWMLTMQDPRADTNLQCILAIGP